MILSTYSSKFKRLSYIMYMSVYSVIYIIWVIKNMKKISTKIINEFHK